MLRKVCIHLSAKKRRPLEAKDWMLCSDYSRFLTLPGACMRMKEGR